MALYSGEELKFATAITSAILDRSSFRAWFLAGTKHGEFAFTAKPIGEKQGTLRNPNLKNPYWFNYWCPKDSCCECRIGTGIETDILLVLKLENKRRLGVHIEVKRPFEHFGDGQAESYPRRAKCWSVPSTRPRTVWPYEDFITVLVCGRDLSSDNRIKCFDKVIFHDQVAKELVDYPEN